MHHTTHRFAPMARILLACGLLVFVSTPVQAIGLQELYAAAQANDPTYREARHERDAGLQNEIIGQPRVPFVPCFKSRFPIRVRRTRVTGSCLG